MAHSFPTGDDSARGHQEPGRAELLARIAELEAERDRLRERAGDPVREETAELRESERRFRAMANTAPAMLWITDRDNRSIFLSRGWYVFTGQTEAEALGFGWLDAVHPDDRGIASRRFLDAASRREPFSLDHRLRRADGQYRWVMDEGRPRFGSDGRWRGYIGSVIDVHDRRLATDALQASEAKYRALFESIDAGFCVIQMLFDDAGRATDYRFLEANPAFRHQTGLEDAVGRTARAMLPDLEPWWFETYGGVARTGESTRFEAHSPIMGRWFDAFAFRIGAPEERRVALLFTDITAQKQAHEERDRLLAEAEAASAEAEAANRAKAEFLAAMSHELRTPLNAIGGYLDLLSLGVHGPLTEAQQQAVARVIANQRHLLTLINDILSFARFEAGRIPFDIRALPAGEIVASMESLVAQSAEARGVHYSTGACDPDTWFLGDAERVRQVLLNLLGNAVKFTPRGGSVQLSCAAGDGKVHLRVQDTGPGIEEDQQERIFDAFQQVDRRLNKPQEGVGLGLAISRDLARAMHGELSVESAPGQGSTFTLTLPRASGKPEP
jgi:PAS domain S-box-containing protein